MWVLIYKENNVAHIIIDSLKEHIAKKIISLLSLIL